MVEEAVRLTAVTDDTDFALAADHASRLGTYSLAKRILDVVISCLAILVCLPLWAAIVIVIRVTSPGPAIFRQWRPGQYGVPFEILKFRTMAVDAEQRLGEVLTLNQQPDHTLIRIKDDPRVTPIGRFLRRTSLDETPQLLNVLRGEMSLVGPRPISRPIPDPRGLWRLQAKPGITGLWQVNGRKDADCEYMLGRDMEYLAHRSLAYDACLVLRTVRAVIWGRGAG